MAQQDADAKVEAIEHDVKQHRQRHGGDKEQRQPVVHTGVSQAGALAGVGAWLCPALRAM
ncbi:hypothetical protein D3C83_264440 [compost metagenome]